MCDASRPTAPLRARVLSAPDSAHLVPAASCPCFNCSGSRQRVRDEYQRGYRAGLQDAAFESYKVNLATTAAFELIDAALELLPPIEDGRE